MGPGVAYDCVRRTARSGGLRSTLPSRNFDDSEDDKAAQHSMGGGVYAGMSHTLRFPYLLGIAASILLYSITSTVQYFQQAAIAEASFSDRAARTAFFADIDLWVNVLTLVFQLSLTGRLLKRLGGTIILCALPLCSVIGLTLLSLSSTVTMCVAVQVARRVSNFALAAPTREVLFTSLTRENRYKAKNFIDTVVYRAGDQVGSWSYAAMLGLGLSMSGIAIVAVPLSVGWLLLSVWLGRRHEKQMITITEDRRLNRSPTSMITQEVIEESRLRCSRNGVTSKVRVTAKQ